MEVLNLLTTNKFLPNSSKILQKSSKMSPKILKNITQNSNSPFPTMSAATLLGPYLVSVWRMTWSRGWLTRGCTHGKQAGLSKRPSPRPHRPGNYDAHFERGLNSTYAIFTMALIHVSKKLFIACSKLNTAWPGWGYPSSRGSWRKSPRKRSWRRLTRPRRHPHWQR